MAEGVTYYGENLTKETDGVRTVAQRLFFDRFWVQVPEAFYQTKESIDVYGMIDYGDKNLNRAAMHRPRQLHIPIAGMCIYLEQGAPLTLVNPTDCTVIYQLLVEHLMNWKTVIGMMGAPNPPLDDLRVMDDFAESLFPLVKAYSPKTIRTSLFRDKLANVGTAPVLDGLGGPIGRTGAQPIVDDGKPKKEEKYQSIADIVAKETFKTNWLN